MGPVLGSETKNQTLGSASISVFPYPIFPLNKHLRTVRLGLHGPIQEVSYRVWAAWPRSLLAMSPVNTGQ